MGEKKTNWGVLWNYVTSKKNNSEVVNNVISERINDKVKSLEDVKISIKKNCKKKYKFSRMFKNNPHLTPADAMKTYDFANRSRWFSDPRVDKAVDKNTVQAVSLSYLGNFSRKIKSKNHFNNIIFLMKSLQVF